MAIKVSKFIELLKNWTLSLRKLDVTSTSYRAALATTSLPPSSVFDYTKIYYTPCLRCLSGDPIYKKKKKKKKISKTCDSLEIGGTQILFLFKKKLL